MKHTERLIDAARRNVPDQHSQTQWGKGGSREYKLGFANWKHYGKDDDPTWCTDLVSLTLKIFADGKERKIFSINNFGASRKACETLINSKIGE